jgi:hypothetical protein
MAGTVEEIMTRNPRTVEIGDSLVDAARAMRDGDIGNVIVTDGGRVAGIVTDRDIVIRAIAEGRDPQSTSVGDVCTSGPRTLEPGDGVQQRVVDREPIGSGPSTAPATEHEALQVVRETEEMQTDHSRSLVNVCSQPIPPRSTGGAGQSIAWLTLLRTAPSKGGTR